MKQKFLFSSFASMLILQSCEKNIDIDFPIAPSPYVIEGYIENGQGPFVRYLGEFLLSTKFLMMIF